MGRLRLKPRPARVPARARRPTRPATPTSPTPPTTASQVFDPSGAYLRTIGVSAHARAACSSRPRGLAVDPTGRLLVSDTDGNRIESFAQGGGALLGVWSQRRRDSDRDSPNHRGDRHRPARLGVCRRHRRRAAGAAVGRRHLPVRTRRPRRRRRRRAQRRRLGRGVLGRRGVRRRHRHNRILVYSPTGALLARVGAGGGNGAAGELAGRFQPPGGGRAGALGQRVSWPTPNNNRVVKLFPDGSCVEPVRPARLPATGACTRRPASRSTPPGGCMWWTTSTTASRCSTNRVTTWPSGVCAAWGSGYLSQPTAIAVGCEGSVYVADTNNNRIERFDPASPAGVGCLPAGAWPPPLDVAPVLRVSLPRRTGILARRRPGAQRQLRTGLSRARHRDAVTALPAPPRGAGRRRPPTAGDADRTRALARRPAALRRLRRALGHHTAMIARVHIVAAGPTGRRTVTDANLRGHAIMLA